MQTSGILGLKVPQTLVCWNQALRTMGLNVSPAPQAPLHPPGLALLPFSYQAVFHGTCGSYKLTKPNYFIPVLGICPLLVIQMCGCDVTVWYMDVSLMPSAPCLVVQITAVAGPQELKGLGCWHPDLGKTGLRTRVNRWQEMAWTREQGHLRHKPGV